MPDSKLIPNARYGWLGHTTYGEKNLKSKFIDITTQLMAMGKVPSINIDNIADWTAVKQLSKDQYFDGFKFEFDIEIDETLTIQDQVIVRVLATPKHPDLQTPIELPEGWVLDFNTTFNGLTLEFTEPYIYKLKTLLGKELYLCEYIKDGERRQLKGTWHRVSNFVKFHKTLPISLSTLEEERKKFTELSIVDSCGITVRQILSYKKKMGAES